MIEVKKYDNDQISYLQAYCDTMKSHGFNNWSSLERMKTNKITYFVAYYKNKIIAVNGLYKLEDHTWVIFARQATLPQYYNLLIPTKKWASNSIQARFLSIPSINYALSQGAKKLIASVNLDNNEGHNNDRNNKHAELMLKMGLWEYDGIHTHNHVKQDIYIINIENFKKFLYDLKKLPVRIRDESN